MGSLKPFRQDMLILLAAVVVIALTLTVADYPRGNPDWYHDYYYHDDDEEAGAGTGGTQEEGPALVPVEESLLSVTGYTAEGRSSTESFTIVDANTTQISAVLTWTDDIGDNDQFSLGLVFEGNNVETVSATTGSLELVYNLGATGDYELVVGAVDCPGSGLGISPVDRDGGNDWQLSASVTVLRISQEEGE